MNEFYIRNVVEAALLAAGKSLTLPELGHLFEDSSRPKAEEIRAALEVLATEYTSRGIEIKETAAGFRIQVRKEFGSEISRLWPERPAKYSRALLETLALIAYRQPITRAEIEAVRGVAVNPNILKTVIERNWVRVVGHRDVPGRPELLGTTREFLDYFGLRSLDELPALSELKAMGEYNLQLELPNAGALGIETSGDGATVGLLDVDGGVADASGVAPVGGLPGEVADGVAVVADAVGVEAVNVDVAEGPVAADGEDADAVAAELSGAEAAGPHHDEGAVDVAVAELEGVEFTVPDLSAADIAEIPSLEWAASDDQEAATATASGGNAADELADVAEVVDAGGDSESDEKDEAAGANDDVEVDRTLSVDFAASGDAADAEGSDSDDAETLDSTASDKHANAVGDVEDDEDDEDELSADGHDSRELVAAPRDIDD